MYDYNVTKSALQQFNVIKENTDLMVDFYHGNNVGNGKKVDEWDGAAWEHVTNKNQVSLFIRGVLGIAY